jgi:uncharacterized repeat protein (TIGR01451 family)
MNDNKSMVFGYLALFAVLVLSAGFARANYLYGAQAPAEQVIIDKQIKGPNGDWLDNISAEEYGFVASEAVDFRIRVKNSGESDIANISVIDYLPSELFFATGPSGQALKWGIDLLEAGEEREYFIQAQVVDSETLAGRGGFCVLNRAKVENETGETLDEDTAQLCIESRVLGAKLPETGVNAVFGLGLALAIAGLGLIILRLRLKR